MLSSVSRDGFDGSQTTMSASLPGAIDAFLRIQPEDARRRRAGHLDEPLGRERRLAVDRGREPERQPRADARQAGRHLREVAGDRQLVAVEPQVAVIRGVRVECAVAQAAQQRGAVGGRAQRRRHHVAQRVRPLVLGPLEAQVVRADLGVDGHARARRAAAISASGRAPVTCTT